MDQSSDCAIDFSQLFFMFDQKTGTLANAAVANRRQMTFCSTGGNVGVGHQHNWGRRQMSFGSTAGNVGQQGTNSGNVAVGGQLNG